MNFQQIINELDSYQSEYQYLPFDMHFDSGTISYQPMLLDHQKQRDSSCLDLSCLGLNDDTLNILLRQILPLSPQLNQRITKLNLEGNPIVGPTLSCLVRSSVFLPNLEYVVFSESWNPWLNGELLNKYKEKGWDNTQSYISTLSNIARSNRVKTVVVGHGMVGKTTLLLSLSSNTTPTTSSSSSNNNNNNNNNNPNFGTNDTEHKIPDPGRSTRVECIQGVMHNNNRWTMVDIPGQTEYYASNSSIVSLRYSVVIVVVKLSETKDKVEEEMLFWLNAINQHVYREHSCSDSLLFGHSSTSSPGRKSNPNELDFKDDDGEDIDPGAQPHGSIPIAVGSMMAASSLDVQPEILLTRSSSSPPPSLRCPVILVATHAGEVEAERIAQWQQQVQFLQQLCLGTLPWISIVAGVAIPDARIIHSRSPAHQQLWSHLDQQASTIVKSRGDIHRSFEDAEQMIMGWVNHRQLRVVTDQELFDLIRQRIDFRFSQEEFSRLLAYLEASGSIMMTEHERLEKCRILLDPAWMCEIISFVVTPNEMLLMKKINPDLIVNDQGMISYSRFLEQLKRKLSLMSAPFPSVLNRKSSRESSSPLHAFSSNFTVTETKNFDSTHTQQIAPEEVVQILRDLRILFGGEPMHPSPYHQSQPQPQYSPFFIPARITHLDSIDRAYGEAWKSHLKSARSSLLLQYRCSPGKFFPCSTPVSIHTLHPLFCSKYFSRLNSGYSSNA